MQYEESDQAKIVRFKLTCQCWKLDCDGRARQIIGFECQVVLDGRAVKGLILGRDIKVAAASHRDRNASESV